MPRPIPPETKATVRRLRVDSQMCPVHIARQLHLSNFSVYRILKDLPRWTDEHRNYAVAEIAALRRLYPVAPRADVLAALPGRDWNNIIKKANSLGLRRKPLRIYPEGLPPLITQLRAERESRGFTRAQFGRIIGHTPTKIAAWELGRYTPLWANLTAWAAALGFDVVLARRDD